MEAIAVMTAGRHGETSAAETYLGVFTSHGMLASECASALTAASSTYFAVTQTNAAGC